MTTIDLEQITTRPVRDSDEKLLFRLFACTMDEHKPGPDFPDEQWKPFVEQQYKLQTAHYKKEFYDGTFDVIEHRGQPVGRITVCRAKFDGLQQIRLIDIIILPEFRKQGIARKVTEELQSESKESGAPIICCTSLCEGTLPHLKNLGFETIEEHELNPTFKWEAS